MMCFVHHGIGIQSRVDHDSIDQVVHNGGDAVDATKSVVEGALLCRMHDESPSGVVVYQNGVWRAFTDPAKVLVCKTRDPRMCTDPRPNRLIADDRPLEG